MLTVIIIVAVFAVISGVLTAVVAIALVNTLKGTKPAVAVVVDNLEEQGDGGKIWQPVVEFADQDNRVHRGALDFHLAPAIPLGTEIPIRFNPHDPSDVRQSASRMAITLAVFGAITAVLLLLLYVLYLLV